MIHKFDPSWRSINLVGQITGPSNFAELLMIFDTGATETAIDLDLLKFIGSEPIPYTLEKIGTASGIVNASLYYVERLEFLGCVLQNVKVRGLEFYSQIRASGIIGWDFLADKK